MRVNPADQQHEAPSYGRVALEMYGWQFFTFNALALVVLTGLDLFASFSREPPAIIIAAQIAGAVFFFYLSYTIRQKGVDAL